MESCYFPISYNKDEKCSHLWETVIDVKGNCGKAEKRHQICTARQDRIIYASSNKRIVTVDARGRVKGIRTGSAVITVKAGRAVYRTVIKVTK